MQITKTPLKVLRVSSGAMCGELLIEVCENFPKSKMVSFFFSATEILPKF